MRALERWSAWLMLANGALGIAVSIGVAAGGRSAAGLFDSPPYVSLLGVLAGLLSLRGKAAGLWIGLAFYAPQVVSYYSSGLYFTFKSGFSLGAIINLPHGVMVINLAALAGLAILVLILARRWRPIPASLN